MFDRGLQIVKLVELRESGGETGGYGIKEGTNG